jgi:hypothetical protein
MRVWLTKTVGLFGILKQANNRLVSIKQTGEKLDTRLRGLFAEATISFHARSTRSNS